MRVVLTATTRCMNRPVERTLTWYNPGTRQIETFKGGSLRFKHVPGLGYMVPEVVEHEEPRWLNSWDSIRGWIEKNAGDVIVLEVEEGAVATIDIDDVHWARLEAELRKERILYESMTDREVYESDHREQKTKKDGMWVKQKDSYSSGKDPWRSGQVPADTWSPKQDRWF